jgi:adenine-specific DNA-methyltransferase
MPTLEWIGKNKVINFHQEVPYRVLEKKYSFNQNDIYKSDIDKENMIIHGDNLEALKSLLPRYEDKVKCIYIDPPYNTGNEGWTYNDNVNDPKIRKWLGDVVGKEGEDLSRHDKWLCMMYPRLKLLRKMLSDEGVIFISIDDNELFTLKLVCDEIFGGANYISTITRPTGTHTGVVNKAIVGASDYILVYAKNINLVGIEGLPMTDKDLKIYDQEDEYGRFLIRPLRRTGGENRREDRPNMYFPLEAPDGTIIYPIGPTGYESRWICNPEGYEYFLSQNRILWKMVKEGNEFKW